jgi:hypothetical protein
MNIEQIIQIVNSDAKEEIKEHLIIRTLALDKKVIPNILKILDEERDNKTKLIADLNVEVSRYNIHINNNVLLKENRVFLNKRTKELYEKWKGFISPLFNNKFL